MTNQETQCELPITPTPGSSSKVWLHALSDGESWPAKERNSRDREGRLKKKRPLSDIDTSWSVNDFNAVSFGQVRNGSTESAVSNVCLCKREEHIKRPRNAFILYRVHHQAAMQAQNPGVPIPELSVKIGKQWKSEPDVIKAEWNVLAEQEKKRHQEAYPNYRYQPRRTGHRNSISESPRGGTSPRCEHCGGFTLLSPTTTMRSPGSRPILPLPTSTIQPPSEPHPERTNSLAPLTYMSSPTSRDHRSHFGSISVPHNARHISEDPTSRSPESIRPVTLPGPYLPPLNQSLSSSTYQNRPLNAIFSDRRDSVRRPSPLQSVNGPNSMSKRSVQNQQSGLTLPPIETPYEASKPPEELIMNAPVIGKIQVLGKVAPPYQYPKSLHGNDPGKHVTRGSIIAVEGDDSSAVGAMVNWFQETLNRSGDYVVRVAHGPAAPEKGKEVTLTEYLQLIEDWHSRGKEMVEFITTNPDRSSNDNSETDGDLNPEPKPRIPVLILHRFHLFAANVFACRIQITDSYDPYSHWRWMAMLWRGIVGPDMTLYVRDAAQEEMAKEKSVEVKEEARCLVVRRAKGPGPVSAGVDEATLRRLSFEAGESIRAVAESKGAVLGAAGTGLTTSSRATSIS